MTTTADPTAILIGEEMPDTIDKLLGETPEPKSDEIVTQDFHTALVDIFHKNLQAQINSRLAPHAYGLLLLVGEDVGRIHSSLSLSSSSLKGIIDSARIESQQTFSDHAELPNYIYRNIPHQEGVQEKIFFYDPSKKQLSVLSCTTAPNYTIRSEPDRVRLRKTLAVNLTDVRHQPPFYGIVVEGTPTEPVMGGSGKYSDLAVLQLYNHGSIAGGKEMLLKHFRSLFGRRQPPIIEVRTLDYNTAPYRKAG